MNVRPSWLLILLACAPLYSQTPQKVEITAEPSHHLVLQNSYVRVFNVSVKPHAATKLHWHRHDYVFITLGEADVSSEVEGKPPVTLQLKDGDTRFTAGNFAHVARSTSDKTFHHVTIEFLKDAQARKSPPPRWDEERGMQVLHGGTLDILFVQDGVRVSEIQLQPGGMIPAHQDVGPHLLVAVSNLELRSDVVGKAPSIRRMSPGEVAWMPGKLTHAVINAGAGPAKFITLEFH
jgi:quercetin dioxygenase-like cupin family protein